MESIIKNSISVFHKQLALSNAISPAAHLSFANKFYFYSYFSA